jgi:PhzF family phenazine biosynthesis protein
MKLKTYRVAAFTGEGLAGNPAAVCLLDDWLSEPAMQAVAAYNGLPETAFLVAGNGGFKIRWFTPTNEAGMCGHATLASTFVLQRLSGGNSQRYNFRSHFGYDMSADAGAEFITLDFPAGVLAPSTSPIAANALKLTPKETLLGESWVCRLASEAAVRRFKPDFEAIAAVPEDGIIVTAPGDTCDFVSRYFTPQSGIPEDPVTGYAHTLLVPYWAQRLGKTTLHARQVSERGGELYCELEGSRVKMAGRAILEGEGAVLLDMETLEVAAA